MASLSQKNAYLWRKLGVPVGGFFELTPRCTLDCKMCYVHLTREQMGERKELTTEQWLRIVDEAVEMGLIRALLTGGECLLHEGFWEIYERLRQKGVLVAVNTNGLLLTDETVERFRRNPPADIRITLYGSDDAGYERCTGHPVFTRVLENIKKLMAAGLYPKLSVTVSRHNRDQFPEILRLAKGLGLRMTYDMELMEAQEGTGRRSEDYALTSEEIVEEMRRLLERGGGKPEPVPPLDWQPRRLPDDPACRGLTCGAGTSDYVIHWDGRMGACFSVDTDVFVQEVGFAAAWEAARALAADFPMPVECRDCPMRPICTNCVLLRRDPADPGHCNPEICRRTLLKYQAGLSGLARHAIRQPGAEPEPADPFCAAE